MIKTYDIKSKALLDGQLKSSWFSSDGPPSVARLGLCSYTLHDEEHLPTYSTVVPAELKQT